MSIFEKNGWYIPLPNSHAEYVAETSIVKGEKGKDATTTIIKLTIKSKARRERYGVIATMDKIRNDNVKRMKDE